MVEQVQGEAGLALERRGTCTNKQSKQNRDFPCASDMCYKDYYYFYYYCYSPIVCYGCWASLTPS